MKSFMSVSLSSLLCAAGCTNGPRPATELESRLLPAVRGDRTGACIAAAVISSRTERAVVCADEKRDLHPHSAFEIGSISKTMTGYLVADAVERGELSLDDPLSSHLPQGVYVPTYNGEPIRLQHLLTHTSGLPSLPSQLILSDPSNPYAALSESAVLASLSEVQLTGAPGSSWAYSNYGFMLLSYVLSHRTQRDFETLLHQRLFAPLGMNAFIERAAEGAEKALGHVPGGSPTSDWDFSVNLAGAGGVRASLDDMILYAEAALGRGPESVVRSMQRALTPLHHNQQDETSMGMGWLVVSMDGHEVHMHDGGTGGFSSLLAISRQRSRAVVLLSDTSLTNLGSLEELAKHLMDPDKYSAPKPRIVAQPSAKVLSALSGQYVLAELRVRLQANEGKLSGMVEGQSDLEFGYDSHGDFYPLALDALLTPVQEQDGTYTFDWAQGGAKVRAERVH